MMKVNVSVISEEVGRVGGGGAEVSVQDWYIEDISRLH